jgi:hypothetical protein
MNETPRTDIAKRKILLSRELGATTEQEIFIEGCSVEFARQLERELCGATYKLEMTQGELQCQLATADKLREELGHAQYVAALKVQEVAAERDKLREELESSRRLVHEARGLARNCLRAVIACANFGERE